MRRVRLRYALPVLFTLLYGGLTYLSDHQERLRQERLKAALQDANLFVKYPDLLSDRPSLATNCLLGISLPAVIVASPLLILLEKTVPETAAIYVGNAIVGCFVFVLWFLLGRWFDRGLKTAPTSSRWLIHAIEVAYSFMLLCDGLLLIILVSSVFAYSVSSGQSLVPMAFLLGWAGLFTFYLNRRRQAQITPLQSSRELAPQK